MNVACKTLSIHSKSDSVVQGFVLKLKSYADLCRTEDKWWEKNRENIVLKEMNQTSNNENEKNSKILKWKRLLVN